MTPTFGAPLSLGSTEIHQQRSCGFSDEFVAANLRRIFVQIYRRVRNVDDAQELTQEVFIKALDSAVHLKDQQKSAHWLSRIASNAVIDFIRKQKRRKTVGIHEVCELADVMQNSPERSAILKDEYDRLSERLKCLSERERIALILRDVEQWPAVEVAQYMECSQATVRSHIANARLKLRCVTTHH